MDLGSPATPTTVVEGNGARVVVMGFQKNQLLDAIRNGGGDR